MKQIRPKTERTCALVDAGAFSLAKSLVLGALSWPRQMGEESGNGHQTGSSFGTGSASASNLLGRGLCVLRTHLAECGAQHVHAHFGSNGADIALLCHLLGGPPYSITIHGPEDFDAPRPQSLREKVHQRQICRRHQQVHSESALPLVPSPEDWPKIHVILLGSLMKILCLLQSYPCRYNHAWLTWADWLSRRVRLF